mmetsp:Transcript_22226/g.68453  ORF Transcript_22226/g.68453 Transcript_22226/m.68453 type:complete len:155 (-) Transcript_22226:575-1039(-)
MDGAADGIQFTMHNVVQPWHAQSSYMHEASFAVANVDAPRLRPFLFELFTGQEEFFDDKTYDLTRAQIYDKLADVAAGVGCDKDAVVGQLACTGTGNGGNAVTQQIKWATKYHRVRAVHVTPTVFVNGIEAPHVSSGWTADEWREFLAPFSASS